MVLVGLTNYHNCQNMCFVLKTKRPLLRLVSSTAHGVCITSQAKHEQMTRANNKNNVFVNGFNSTYSCALPLANFAERTHTIPYDRPTAAIRPPATYVFVFIWSRSIFFPSLSQNIVADFSLSSRIVWVERFAASFFSQRKLGTGISGSFESFADSYFDAPTYIN